MSDPVPALPLYSKYRITFSKAQAVGGAGNSYIALREVGLYAKGDATGINLAPTSTVTVSGSYSASNGPEKFVDGDLNTYWESNAFIVGNGNVWVQFSFPSVIEMRAIRMAGGISSYANETPRDFVVSASNDGVTWTTLLDVKDWGGYSGGSPFLVDAVMRFDLIVSGTSRLATGARSSAVFLHDFESGVLAAKVIPASDGSYQHFPQRKAPLLITHVGPEGYAPQSDGPVQPIER